MHAKLEADPAPSSGAKGADSILKAQRSGRGGGGVGGVFFPFVCFLEEMPLPQQILVKSESLSTASQPISHPLVHKIRLINAASVSAGRCVLQPQPTWVLVSCFSTQLTQTKIIIMTDFFAELPAPADPAPPYTHTCFFWDLFSERGLFSAILLDGFSWKMKSTLPLV